MYREEETGLGIWFKDGIENILLAIDEANLDMVSRFDAPEVRIYRQGFAAAISAVATAFGIRSDMRRLRPRLAMPRASSTCRSGSGKRPRCAMLHYQMGMEGE
jgi:hypothetical protein